MVGLINKGIIFFLLRWFLCVFGKGFLSELFGPKDKFFPDVMQNLGSSAVKNTYLHTKQLEKIFTSRKTQTILTPHKTTGKRPKRQEKHLCFLRSRHGKNQFRGHGFLRGAVLDKLCKVLLAMGHFKWERNLKKCRLIFGWPFHLPQMWQFLGWKVLLNWVVVVSDGK